MAPRALATRRPAATVSRLGRCPANLCREALDLASRALARIAAPSRPNPKIIVANRHVSPEIGAATRRHIEIAPYSENRAISIRSEEHTSELQSLMRISYAVFCLKKKNKSKK